MSDFKGRRFTDLILLCVRWYCKFGISYRDLEEMTGERGVAIDHTTLFRWVQHFAPLMDKRIRWYQRYTDEPWRVDETYMTVAGQWAYLYRAIDKNGDLIDFMLSPRRTRYRRGASLGMRCDYAKTVHLLLLTRPMARPSARCNRLAGWQRVFSTGRSNI